MELVAILLLYAVTALVLYRVLLRRPDEHLRERRPDAPKPGIPQARRRPF
jgi:hypothetical protein